MDHPPGMNSGHGHTGPPMPPGTNLPPMPPGTNMPLMPPGTNMPPMPPGTNMPPGTHGHNEGSASLGPPGTTNLAPPGTQNLAPPGTQNISPPGTQNIGPSGVSQGNENMPPGPPNMGQGGPMAPPGSVSHGIGPPGMGPPGMGPPGMGPPGMGPQGMGPPGMGPSGMGPPGIGPPGMGPQGMGPPGMGPPGIGPPGMGPPGMGPMGMGPPGMGPPAMGSLGMGPPGIGPDGPMRGGQSSHMQGPPPNYNSNQENDHRSGSIGHRPGPMGHGPGPMGPPGMGPPGMGPPGRGPPGMNMQPPHGWHPDGPGPPGWSSDGNLGHNQGPPRWGSDNQGPLQGPPGWEGPPGWNGPNDNPPPGWDEDCDIGRDNREMGRDNHDMGRDNRDMGRDNRDMERDNCDMDDGPPPPRLLAPSSNLPSLLSLKIDKPEELKPKVLVLPKALEEALAFKDQRAAALGKESDDQTDGNHPSAPPPPVISSEYDAEEDEGDSDDEGSAMPTAPKPPVISKQEGANKANKNKRKKKRKKVARANRKLDQEKKKVESQKKLETDKEKDKDKDTEEAVEVEYIQESVHFHEMEPMYRQFHRILEAFKIVDIKEEEDKDNIKSLAPKSSTTTAETLKDAFENDEETEEKKAADEKDRLSKRKLKKLSRLSVAELKQLVSRPDVVEMYDVTARDPRLLVQLKAHRNTVQVPRHWCYKRKYLQGKRGIEKPAFDLPDFIKKTGIMEMRASLQDKEETKTLKAKMRERARPKLGKIDIDYQKLHDAFFKWQTKPKMTIHGDLYYEGKEFETRLREKKPGDLTEDLRTALGMPVGPGSHKVPPPWLIAQQRYGPPPSYPNLKIPGLNAPIPDGCAFGYHAGGWGKPPVDETGKPLYGDVFGHTVHAQDDSEDVDIDRTMWGELESESEGESSEEESSDEEGATGEGELAAGLATPGEGLMTPSGLSSVALGMETPDTIELRKKKIESDMEGGDTPALYQVLPERRVGVTGGMMASTHVYDMTGAPGQQAPPPPAIRRVVSGGGGGGDGSAVELALDPSELELDAEAMAARYERQLREQRAKPAKEDLSDMLAEHVARQKTKRKRQQTTDAKQAKKYKEFKF